MQLSVVAQRVGGIYIWGQRGSGRGIVITRLRDTHPANCRPTAPIGAGFLRDIHPAAADQNKLYSKCYCLFGFSCGSGWLFWVTGRWLVSCTCRFSPAAARCHPSPASGRMAIRLGVCMRVDGVGARGWIQTWGCRGSSGGVRRDELLLGASGVSGWVRAPLPI